MTSIVVAVRDVKLGEYGQLVTVTNGNVAIRSFGDMVEKGDNPFAAHPEDYQLYQLGIYDNVKGRVDNLLVPELLCSASDFIKLKSTTVQN